MVTLVEIPTKVSLLFSVVCVPTIYTSTIVHSLVLSNAINKGCSNYIKTRVLHLRDVSRSNNCSILLHSQLPILILPKYLYLLCLSMYVYVAYP